MRTLCTLLLTAVTPLPLLAAADTASDFRIPPGFEITEFASEKLANDIYTLTIDPRGRVVVAGRGYIRILADDDRDGRADRAIDFADSPKDGAMGLLWEGSTLYVVGDGGLRRFTDQDRDDRADGPSELILKLKTGGEHDAHAVRRGPDGWLYVLCGNSAGVDKTHAQEATSPIRRPVAGAVLRISPDGEQTAIVADGFRNPYGMDFNPDGELFTYDSDNERCVSLPWYEGTRFYQVVPGGRYGWQTPPHGQFWRQPPHFADVVPPIADLGRGSPTGVVCYRHLQFPEAYRGGFFLLDWTFGRVYFVKLRPEGASYSGKPEVFLEATGDNGFAPTAAAVHPETGDLFVSIGGRGTRGAVYRIRYPKGVRSFTAEELRVLQPSPRSLDWRPGLDKALLEPATSGTALERRKALDLAYRHGDRLATDQRAAMIRGNWDHADRSVRQAVIRLIEELPQADREALRKHAETPRAKMCLALALADTSPSDACALAIRIFQHQDANTAVRLSAVRVLQRALGDISAASAKGQVWEGYTPRSQPEAEIAAQIRAPLRAAFPTGERRLDGEMARTLALIADDDRAVLGCIVKQLTEESDPRDDFHYLIVLARLRGARSEELTPRIAAALLALDRKAEKLGLIRDRNWPLRTAELYAELARRDPRLHAAVLAHPDFGRPEHAVLARTDGFDRRRAAGVFLARSKQAADFAWNPALVDLLGVLPEEQALPVLRGLWENQGLREAILSLLARQPKPEDRERFLAGLASSQPELIRLSLTALEKLPVLAEPASLIPIIRCLRRLSDGPEERPVRERLSQYLHRATGHEATTPQAWSEWFLRKYPEMATKLGGPDSVDRAAWERRLAAVDWAAGQPERGRAVYAKAGCAACHSGAQVAQALGPDLRGVAGRFSRADLFTAIVQPSRDVSPRYQATLISTTDGKVHQGAVIYEAVDGVIVQTGAATTIRIPGNQIADRRTVAASLMPAGLLDEATDRDLADLYAYLRTLTEHRQPGAIERPKEKKEKE